MTDTPYQASGTVGPHVVKALLDANFSVTVLTRSKASAAYDPSVKVVEVDYASMDSVTAALEGVDALVSTVGAEATEKQTVLIDAAVAAGVKRFIPSEYGSVSTNPEVEGFPIYAPMFKIKHYLREKAEAGQLTWTVLACGAFLDLLLGRPILLDFANHKSTFYDEGDNRISSTSLPSVGKAIAGILSNLEATKNKVVRVSQVIVTQKEVLKIAQELKPEIQWDITKVATTVLLQEGLDAVRAGDYSMPTLMKVLAGTVFAGDRYGSAYDETDNQLLGVKELTKEDLTKLIAEKLA